MNRHFELLLSSKIPPSPYFSLLRKTFPTSQLYPFISSSHSLLPPFPSSQSTARCERLTISILPTPGPLHYILPQQPRHITGVLDLRLELWT